VLFAIFGGAAFEASIITWCAHHRFHHRYVDTDEDPYDATEGFWHSHMGWLLKRGAKYGDLSNVPDLWKDPICRWQHRHFMAIAIGTNVIITLLLGLLTGHMLGMVVFALLLRMLLLHHFTWLINSAAHMWGSQPWSRGHTARDSWLLSIFTFGEGYHNYHHTFQADYRNGPVWYNLDVTKWLIWTLSRVGLAGGLRRVPAEVTLTRRFELARKDLDGRIQELDDRARAIVREHLEPLEQLCEEALTRLETAHQRLKAAAREAAGRSRELRKLRASLRLARKRARRAVRQWQTSTRMHLATLEPVTR
jgi:stearoyl-CoA desaturase (delta-9 desaturase)